MKIIKTCAPFFIFFFNSMNAGIVILCEVPEGIKQLLEKTRQIAHEYIEIHNQGNNNKKYIFDDAAKFAPHLTLAYLSDQKLTLDELKKEYPQLPQVLEEFASNSKKLPISSNLNDIKLLIFKSRFENEYEGIKYKNYQILALNITPSARLMKLIDKLDAVMLTQGFERKLPFKAHVTICRIYDEDDIDVTYIVEKIKQSIEQYIKDFQIPHVNFTIDTIKLSAHDQNAMIFGLN